MIPLRRHPLLLALVACLAAPLTSLARAASAPEGCTLQMGQTASRAIHPAPCATRPYDATKDSGPAAGMKTD